MSGFMITSGLTVEKCLSRLNCVYINALTTEQNRKVFLQCCFYSPLLKHTPTIVLPMKVCSGGGKGTPIRRDLSSISGFQRVR